MTWNLCTACCWWSLILIKQTDQFRSINPCHSGTPALTAKRLICLIVKEAKCFGSAKPSRMALSSTSSTMKEQMTLCRLTSRMIVLWASTFLLTVSKSVTSCLERSSCISSWQACQNCWPLKRVGSNTSSSHITRKMGQLYFSTICTQNAKLCASKMLNFSCGALHLRSTNQPNTSWFSGHSLNLPRSTFRRCTDLAKSKS